MVEDQITVIVPHPPDPAGFFLALDRLEVVTWARVESMDDERAVFRVQVASFMGLIRSLLALEAPNRPSRLQLSGTVVTVYLAPPGEQGVAPTGAPPARTGAGGEGGPRFELAVDAFFGARHFIFSNDRQGPPHHHSYRVEAVLQSATQDRDGFVIGFAQAREMIESTVMEFNETLLNTIDPFLETQPTTENLARVIHDRIAERMAASPARLRQVRVWESPTNSAIYSDAAVTS
jgi:6-pyruvoyl-tetrahydropterin synthase